MIFNSQHEQERLCMLNALHTFWRERVAYFNYITVPDKVPTTTTYEHEQIMAEYFYF